MKKPILFLFFVALFYNSLGQIVPSYVPVAGLVAWYPLDGNAYDSSGNGNNGIPYGAVSYGTDRFGNPNGCFKGDTISAINIPKHNFPIMDAARTVSAFFKLQMPFAKGPRIIFDWGNNSYTGGRFGLFTKDTIIGLEYMNASVTKSFAPDTFWHNLTITYPAGGGGSSAVKVYFDGEIAVTSILVPISSFMTDTGLIHCIGTFDLAPTYRYGWFGQLDDIGVWDRELTSCEVESIFYGPNPPVPAITETGSVLGADSMYSSYQWIRNGALITGATSDSYTTSSSGLYSVAVITKGGCFDTSAIVEVGTTNVHSISSENNISIYPNPVTSSELFIESSGQVNIILTNAQGSIIKKVNDAKVLDLSMLPAGIYFMSIFDELHGYKIKTERISKL